MLHRTNLVLIALIDLRSLFGRGLSLLTKLANTSNFLSRFFAEARKAIHWRYVANRDMRAEGVAMDHLGPYSLLSFLFGFSQLGRMHSLHSAPCHLSSFPLL